MSQLFHIGSKGVRSFELKEICHESIGHSHNYDHETKIIKGRLRVNYNDDREPEEYGEGESFIVKAKVHHTLKALEQNTIYHCIFDHRDFDGEITQKYLGNVQAYC